MCESLFPEMPPKAQEVLYIIGNGFDISHSINSRYSDFERWVKAKGNNQLIGMMDVFFSNEHYLWADVETALGEYREEDILDYCKPDGEIDYDHMPLSSVSCQKYPTLL